MIIPNTQNGTSSNLKEWLPIESLHKKAVLTLHKSINKNISHKIDRIDIRKNKGVAKFIFEEDLWEVQLDGAIGKVLSVQKRYSDLLENIHDASILDDYFNTSNNQIKVFYTTVMGLSLLLFTVTGFWLWYGPKQMKKGKKSIKS